MPNKVVVLWLVFHDDDDENEWDCVVIQRWRSI
jgi:hypothetical protein